MGQRRFRSLPLCASRYCLQDNRRGPRLKIFIRGVLLCHCSGLGHCCGTAAIPGPRPSTCLECGKKQTNKQQPKTFQVVFRPQAKSHSWGEVQIALKPLEVARKECPRGCLWTKGKTSSKCLCPCSSSLSASSHLFSFSFFFFFWSF